MMLTVPGSLDDVGPPSNTRHSGRGIGLTVVPGGADDINTGRGLLFSPVTVSNLSFSGSLADTNFSFTPGSVSNFGVQLFASGVFNENNHGMLLTQGEDTVADPGEGTIGFGGSDSLSFQTGTIASYLRQDLNFGIYNDPVPNPPYSSEFPRQTGPFTLLQTVGVGTIRGFTLGYDVSYDISPASATEDADFDGDDDVDGADFLTWQRGFGTLAPVGTHATGDADFDHDIDLDDLAAWKATFGNPAVVTSAERNFSVRPETTAAKQPSSQPQHWWFPSPEAVVAVFAQTPKRSLHRPWLGPLW